jgi:hypothetical protein
MQHGFHARAAALGGWLQYDALGDIGATFKELEWKMPIFSGRLMPKTPNAR